MAEDSIYQQYRDIKNKLVGHWYAEAVEQTLIFYFSEKPTDTEKLTMISKDLKTVDTFYSVGTYLDENIQSVFYIDIGLGWELKRYYKIKNLTSTKMSLIEIDKTAERKEMGNEFSYTRKIDVDFVDGIIEGLS